MTKQEMQLIIKKIEDKKKKSAIYYKEYQTKNKNKLREYHKKYREKNKEKIKKQQLARYYKNKKKKGEE